MSRFVSNVTMCWCIVLVSLLLVVAECADVTALGHHDTEIVKRDVKDDGHIGIDSGIEDVEHLNDFRESSPRYSQLHFRKSSPRYSQLRHERYKREINSSCDPKYYNFRATHTNCLIDNPTAELMVLSQDDKDRILKLHNDYRRNVDPPATNMLKLQWDERLEATAKKLALQCQGNHDNMKDRSEPDWPLVSIGQNIALGHASWEAALSRFYTEKDRVNYVYGEGYIKGSGHFFQMVSYEASRVGCAYTRCPNLVYKRLRVCNYAAGLNAARPPYKNGTSCGDCPQNCDSSGKLCDCQGKLCYNMGEVDPADCQCSCREGKTGENCEKIDCDNPDPFFNCRVGTLSRENCGQANTVIADPTMCPHLCGYCNSTCGGKICYNGFVRDPVTCKCVCHGRQVGQMCEPLPEWCHVTSCQNFGTYHESNCTCTCQGDFTGPSCEICPSADEDFCVEAVRDVCLSNPKHKIRVSCPYMCEVCPNAEGTDEGKGGGSGGHTGGGSGGESGGGGGGDTGGKPGGESDGKSGAPRGTHMCANAAPMFVALLFFSVWHVA